MNIAKLQAQLQKVPDQALIGYVQNPDGQVPSFLALAELTRRKEIRQAGATQQAAPTQTVAQQAVAQAEPGIAQLPVREDMFNEQSMAAGGIVAFEDGGEVKRFDGLTGSDVMYEPPAIQLAELGSNSRTAQEDIARRFQAAKKEFAAGKMPKVVYDDLVGTLNEESKQIKNGLNLGANKPVDEMIVAPAVEVPAKKQVGGINFNLPNRFNDITVPDAVKLNREEFVGEAPTLSGIQALRKDAYKKAGVSEDMYDKMQQDIEARRAGMGKEKEDAVANALLMAGLGIAGGRSQNWVTNVAEGAMPAVRELRTDMKDLLNKKDKLAEREFAVMEAQNKFRQTGADSDLKTLTDKQNSYDTARRDYAKTDAQLQDSQVGRKFSLETSKANEAGQNDRAILSAQLQDKQLKISQFNADTQRMIANKPELFTTIMNNLESDPDYKKADGKGKVKMITEAVSDAKSTSVAGLNDNTLRTKALEITSKYFEAGGPGNKEYKKLLKTDPAAAQKMYNDYFNQQLGLAKSTLGGTPAAASADPLGIL